MTYAFELIERYKNPPMPVMAEDYLQASATISNLMADMMRVVCPRDHLTRSIQYSLVVMDCQKHQLDYHQAFEDFGIQELLDLYTKE